MVTSALSSHMVIILCVVDRLCPSIIILYTSEKQSGAMIIVPINSLKTIEPASLGLVPRPHPLTRKKGSGDLRLIPWASLKLIAFQ